jgi:hypothetical protein
MRLDHPLEHVARQRVPLNRRQQFCCHRIGLSLAMRGARQQIAPPLQADLAGKRLAARIRAFSTLKALSASSERRAFCGTNSVAA